MQTEEQETPMEFIAATTWQTTLFLGVATVILGLIVSFHPSGSLNVIAVLVGILMIISGIFHLIRVFDTAEQHRVWHRPDRRPDLDRLGTVRSVRRCCWLP